MRSPIALLILASLVGCGESKPPSSKLTSEQRSKIDTQRAHEPPGMIVQKIDGGEMVVLTVPTGGTEKRLDVQRCFLWRDSYYRTTSMSCPADQSGFEDVPQPSRSTRSGNVGFNP